MSIYTYIQRLGKAVKDFFADVKKANCVDIYIRTASVENEKEVYCTHLVRPDFQDLCKIFNFLPDNKHEGAGWWERVELVRESGLNETEIADIIDSRPNNGRLWTYVPEEILRDLKATSCNEIGFAPHGEDKFHPDTRVVWFHLVR